MRKKKYPLIEMETLLSSFFSEKMIGGEDGRNEEPKVPIYRRKLFRQGRRIKVNKNRRPGINKGVNDGCSKSTIRITRINGGAKRASIKGTIFGKTNSLLMCRDPRKLKKSPLKRRPRRRGVVPQLLPPTSPESMHLEFSPLWAQILTIMSI